MREVVSGGRIYSLTRGSGKCLLIAAGLRDSQVTGERIREYWANIEGRVFDRS